MHKSQAATAGMVQCQSAKSAWLCTIGFLGGSEWGGGSRLYQWEKRMNETEIIEEAEAGWMVEISEHTVSEQNWQDAPDIVVPLGKTWNSRGSLEMSAFVLACVSGIRIKDWLQYR